MADSTPVYHYAETRLNLDSATQDSTIIIHLPAHGGPTWPSKTAQKRPQIADVPVAEDETIFRQRHLATVSSIYHRQYHTWPRSFLWRVLEDGKTLSLRAVDISRRPESTDAILTLRFQFPSPIRQGCIAFSDAKEHDVLNALILLESNHLFTLTLRPDDFRRLSSTEGRVGDLSKSYIPAPFSIKHPHRLAALSADELLVSLHDGSLLKLVKKPGGDGASWKEVFYNEGGWSQGLRSLIPFQGNNTFRYGKINIEHSAVTSIATPCVTMDDAQYLFTVSLDHRLRVWNLSTGRIAYTTDIVGNDIDTNDPPRQFIHPSHSQLVKVIVDNPERSVCVTYSPIGTGQFKFWQIRPGQDGKLDLTDLFPSNALEPHAPTSDVWTLADFSVHLDYKSKGFVLWTLWKNNTAFRVQNLNFQVGTHRDIQDAWRTGWFSVAMETLEDSSLPVVLFEDPEDVTNKWLEYLLLPGRFTTATLETALTIYQNGLGASKGSTRQSWSLAERLCSAIASTAVLSQKADCTTDHEQFIVTTDAQWRRFYRLLAELNKQQGEAVSLVVDPNGKMPWVILADKISAVRDCSDAEQIVHNTDQAPTRIKDALALTSAAAAFRASLSDQFISSFDAAVVGDLFEKPSMVDPIRMRSIYEKCDFENQITDEDYTQLVDRLGGGFQNLTHEVYEQILNAMSVYGSDDKRSHSLPLAEFGNKLIVEAVQQTVELHRKICLDQLILLVLIKYEINDSDESIQFDTAAVFSQFITTLKRIELLRWLGSRQIALREMGPKSMASNRSVTQAEIVSVLEGAFRHIWGLDTRKGESISLMLTGSIIQICSPDSDIEISPSLIQCFLLTQNRPELAMEFSRFTDSDVFSTYIHGRVMLASDDAFGAAMHFKKAAFGLGFPNSKKRIEYHSAGLLDDTEKKLFNAGLPEYYSHIVALYDKEKNFSFVIDFARLALQFVKPGSEDVPSMILRTEMHSRLFNAAVQTSRWELAHSVLTLFTDTALQQSSLRTLITKMCESSCASQLIELPFIGLHDNVDEILAQKCQSIVEVTVGVQYHKILYAWRIKRNDFRGAAAISLERLEKLQQSGEGDRRLDKNELDTPVTRQYITLINALSCVDPKQAYILAEEPPTGSNRNGASLGKRRVVTLEEIRKAYQDELDRLAAIENNQFAFNGGDEMEVL